MSKYKISLLRGVCQLPAYMAHEEGFFHEEGLDVEVEIAATAWLVPHKLKSGECQFAVMPWTRVAADEDGSLVLLSGSGCEEAAIVLKNGISMEQVKSVAIPQRGGIKDLTAMGLIESLGWKDVKLIRTPSGDGAIIAFFGQGADAASMVEPYATMMEMLGVGTVVRRTGDLWKGAPGCSLTTTHEVKTKDASAVEAVVRAYVRGAEAVHANPDLAAEIGSRYIAIRKDFIREALNRNRPNVRALHNSSVMKEIIGLMTRLGYLSGSPASYLDLTFLNGVLKSSLDHKAESELPATSLR